MKAAAPPRISFGLIVLNGQPFLPYLLRSLYPHAHEIIVVEGASPGAVNIATGDGHSRDGTLEAVRGFQATEDPFDKVTLITAEDAGHPDGVWRGEKDEQSQAYAARATGDYLWQVDVDEFYRDEDIRRVTTHLREHPEITGMSFEQISFWGHPSVRVDGWYLDVTGLRRYRRLFRWGRGYRYVTHRPPTVIDDRGRDLTDGAWLDGVTIDGKPTQLFHYSLLFPKQVREKCDYYERADWSRRRDAVHWAESCFVRLEHPFRVHNVPGYPSWLESFESDHPEQVRAMFRDILAGRIEVELRDMTDAEALLSSARYRLGRSFLKASTRPYLGLRAAGKSVSRLLDPLRRRLGRRA